MKMSKVNLEIDGKEIEAEEGETILEAAEEHDIKIPTHCHKKPYEPAGLCRICVVEVTPPKGSSELHTACTYPVQEGLVVETNTERVEKARKLAADLLLARCPNSDAVLAFA